MINLLSPENGSLVDLCSNYQFEFHNCNTFKSKRKFIKKLLKTQTDFHSLNYPNSVVFKWESDVVCDFLYLSEDEDFTNFVKYEIVDSQLSIYNLKKNTEYYWKIDNSTPMSFKTDSLYPRWVYIDGLYNVRDMASDYIKQGLCYRGVRGDGFITEYGKEYVSRLNIKTQIDLRRESFGKISSSPLGENVKYMALPCNGYEEFFTNDDKENILQIFSLLSDINNYPIYFNCAGGQDRTGTIAFFIESICGADNKTLIDNYELTMLSSPDKKLSRSRKGKIKKFLRLVKNFNRNAQYSDNAVNLLKQFGVNESDITNIKKILKK